MKKQLFFIIYLFCFLIYVSYAQDNKPKVKTKPAATTKPPAVKTQPKTNTTQTDNKYGTVTDIDGNIYKTVKIGNQIWMAENLKTTRYNDGTPIPNVTDDNKWENLTTGAYCFYDNDYSNNALYGKLYNWYAVETGKLAPKGWHVPSDKEWQQLINYLGGEKIAGGKMKSILYWVGDEGSPFVDEKGNPIGSGLFTNEIGSNSSGFNSLPAGSREPFDGSFYGIGSFCFFWFSTAYSMGSSWGLDLKAFNSYAFAQNYLMKSNGFSVRCIKD